MFKKFKTASRSNEDRTPCLVKICYERDTHEFIVTLEGEVFGSGSPEEAN